MKNKTTLKTHARNILGRVNITEENILVYSKNNSLSDSMTRRLLDAYNGALLVQENVTLDEYISSL